VIEPEDLKALDERIGELIDGQARMMFAAALRMQAVSLRSQAELLTAQAETLDATAREVEEGRRELPARPVRMVLVEDEAGGDEAAAEEDAERHAARVQRVQVGTFGTHRVIEPTDAAVGGEFTEAMRAWLAEFDDRIRMMDGFVDAVNEAAEAGRAADLDTARLVAERARELRDERDRRA
jgi:hypothetical protein